MLGNTTKSTQDCIGPDAIRQDAAKAGLAQPHTPSDTPQTVQGLYLHLPFCFHTCHYCDFYSVVEPEGQDAPRQTAFTDALLAEIDAQASSHTIRPTTLFAGGGTPTYLRPELWQRLLAKLNQHDLLIPGTGQEFTVEANPETVTPELMRILADGGVNRVSIGAQSFDRDALKTLERWHEPDSVARAVAMCRAAGIDNLSLDLIFAIPGQTLDRLRADLDALLALEPTHLSTYGLTYEPNTPLTAKLRIGRINPIDESLEREMFALVLETIEAAGFVHYEVSNWAKAEPIGPTDSAEPTAPHRENRCQHNLGYWRSSNWLGLGPGAASHVNGHRWRNTPNLTRYLHDIGNPPTEDHERLDDAGRFAERLMLGLRLSEGIDAHWFDHHPALRPDQRETMNEWIERGLLEAVDGRLRLTRTGLFVADAVIAKLM